MILKKDYRIVPANRESILKKVSIDLNPKIEKLLSPDNPIKILRRVLRGQLLLEKLCMLIISGFLPMLMARIEKIVRCLQGLRVFPT